MEKEEQGSGCSFRRRRKRNQADFANRIPVPSDGKPAQRLPSESAENTDEDKSRPSLRRGGSFYKAYPRPLHQQTSEAFADGKGGARERMQFSPQAETESSGLCQSYSRPFRRQTSAAFAVGKRRKH
ncbi:hypothetical protein [Dysosmobacter sp.]|uniref:hypothetical protein n=1 Tax=Dysosmobacter sp. TaxID=2591382 RepID=UPI002A86D675|nr:hypothetical protein [Dysosmobacter sp.]MDY3281284.1 hypothetical protein [Dysosmobacter sp.]